MLTRRISVASAFPASRAANGPLPAWLRDVIDAVFVAVVLVTLALVAL
jgi:hypothetical protein